MFMNHLIRFMAKISQAIPIIITLFSFLFLYHLISTSHRIPQSHFDKTDPKSNQSKWIDYKLSEAASMIAQNNTLIVCTVSEPFLPLFNNWLISVSKHNHENMVLVIAEDYQSLFQVNKNFPGHAVMLAPPINNSRSAKYYGSEDFYVFTSRRPHYLLRILELGYNVLFNDVDMVWVADPLPYMVEEYDVYIADDSLHKEDTHNLRGSMNICGGMIYMRPTTGSKLLMKKWIDEIRSQPWIEGKNTNGQPAFNNALKKTFGQVKTYVLPQTAFPPGRLYFNNTQWVNENKGRIAIIHNNWIVGLETKIQRFKNYGLWFINQRRSLF